MMFSNENEHKEVNCSLQKSDQDKNNGQGTPVAHNAK